jgi:hypothetical protein
MFRVFQFKRIKIKNPLTFSTVSDKDKISCWNCHKEDNEASLICKSTSCGAVQTAKLHAVDLFQMFNLEPKFNIDISALDSKLKELQSKLHPDKYALKTVDEKNASADASTTVNQGYQVHFTLLGLIFVNFIFCLMFIKILKSPVCRAEYLVLFYLLILDFN